ncbi:MAG: 7-carboxy-7-deazaguanine synthase QueE [Nitrospira sp.]|nr:7-carboxy-7-deazaguanine synthase QueE [Nitrospira sp.]
MTGQPTLRITEIFYSIQGESTKVGLPCVFIRLTGCPLRCTWCDTEYAFHEGRTMTMQAVLDEVKTHGCSLVEVTGGEPLHQPNALVLLTELCNLGYDVMLETSGAFDVSGVDKRVSMIMDVKCPGSGMMDRMLWTNLNHLSSKDEVKFVVKDRRDYEWVREFIHRHALRDRCSLLVSPVFGTLAPQSLAQWALEDRLPVRFQLQLHKYIWDPQARGV